MILQDSILIHSFVGIPTTWDLAPSRATGREAKPVSSHTQDASFHTRHFRLMTVDLTIIGTPSTPWCVDGDCLHPPRLDLTDFSYEKFIRESIKHRASRPTNLIFTNASRKVLNRDKTRMTSIVPLLLQLRCQFRKTRDW